VERAQSSRRRGVGPETLASSAQARARTYLEVKPAAAPNGVRPQITDEIVGTVTEEGEEGFTFREMARAPLGGKTGAERRARGEEEESPRGVVRVRRGSA
jgi:hypothetical protein